jgi:hypothetical protein
MVDSQVLRDPIGKYQRPAYLPLDDQGRAALIRDIERAPGLRAAVDGLSETQLDIPYRPGGWTIRQEVHHVPDSHMNGYVRTRLAMTEDNPTIKLYREALWAELPDVRTVPIDVSLALLDALHVRWAALLRGLAASDFQRTFHHPELGPLPLDVAIGIYAWHGQHHTAHITNALKSAHS